MNLDEMTNNELYALQNELWSAPRNETDQQRLVDVIDERFRRIGIDPARIVLGAPAPDAYVRPDGTWHVGANSHAPR